MDVIPERVEQLNARQLPILDKEIEAFQKRDDLYFQVTIGAAFVIIATPTDYDPVTSW